MYTSDVREYQIKNEIYTMGLRGYTCVKQVKLVGETCYMVRLYFKHKDEILAERIEASIMNKINKK